jgi:hypothetical protein
MIAAIARLTWKRLWRGKSIWVTAILLLVPIGLAAMAVAGVPQASERWGIVGEITLRSLVMLAPVLHLAPAVGEESEGKTYSYLWSRPVPREALVLGKMLAVTPLLALLAAGAVAAAWAISSAGAGPAGDPAWLGSTLLAAVLGVVTSSCFAVGVGSLFPKHPLVIAFGYIFLAEQALPEINAVQNLSVLFHTQQVAKLPTWHHADDGGGAIGLAVLAAFWLAIAIWRVRNTEFGSAEG